MRVLLFDQDLSRHLVGHLRDFFPHSAHVTSLEVDSATDHETWDNARQHDYMVVPKDSDFRPLAFLHGPPPKVLWVRAGNVSTADILQILAGHVEAIERFVADGEEALLVLAPPAHS
ncbi:MAG: DUF5615 family PIN-like protein [Acidimicrobiia bacterium]|nr:DUF5615 family PIN-like protein [Acidimicrobiia bacterium]